MNEMQARPQPGPDSPPAAAGESTSNWRIGQSIPLELDAVLRLIGECGAQPGRRDLCRQVDDGWLAGYADFYGRPAGPVALLARVGDWAGVLHEADYSRATLAMRALTVPQALAAVRRQVAAAGILDEAGADPGQAPAEQLATLTVCLVHHLYRELGLAPAAPAEQVRAEVLAAAAVLHDGPHHARFWHWLDRFYYGIYHPWRASQESTLATLRAEGIVALGARAGAGAPPVAWLPAQNPLRYRPDLAVAVAAGRLDVYFWVEPLEMADVWFLFPGQLVVGLARPGECFDNFRAQAEAVARRTKALSDPTRLLILRLIRNLSMDNTAMADLLEVTRPTVSIHTRILREAGLIRTRQVGRRAQHEIVPAAIRTHFRELEQFLDLPAAAGEEA